MVNDLRNDDFNADYYKASNIKGPNNWKYHIVPIVDMAGSNWIFDPALFNRPVSCSLWKTGLNTSFFSTSYQQFNYNPIYIDSRLPIIGPGYFQQYYNFRIGPWKNYVEFSQNWLNEFSKQ